MEQITKLFDENPYLGGYIALFLACCAIFVLVFIAFAQHPKQPHKHGLRAGGVIHDVKPWLALTPEEKRENMLKYPYSMLSGAELMAGYEKCGEVHGDGKGNFYYVDMQGAITRCMAPDTWFVTIQYHDVCRACKGSGYVLVDEIGMKSICDRCKGYGFTEKVRHDR